ncbi:hypothetical protein [Mycobacterium paragordonae]|uniref:Uncharacterized protein n=1 Tax=Mycobacterium paragordonae TaxID=1389713 RepID=A0AAJ1VZA6_9MYCO|nr:hypothetical protein [Mycobacterium paragordonae]MDP7733685.1 hypothetical protein [Mycobacterium paragordonae]
MTMIDPWANPPAQEAQAPAQPAPTPPPAPAPAPAPAAVAAPVAHVVNNSGSPVSFTEGKVTVTFKGGTGYDSPWIVLYGENVQEAYDQVTGESAGVLAALMQRVQLIAKDFSGQGGAPAAPAQPSNAAPAAAQQAPQGQTRQCKHGQMQFKSGFSQKNNRAWEAFFCPTPKNAPDQCEAIFL